MDSKDELLAKLREIDQAQSPQAEPELKAISPPAIPPATQKTTPQISAEEFLAQLAALDQSTRPRDPLAPTVASASISPSSTRSTPPHVASPHPAATSSAERSTVNRSMRGNHSPATSATPIKPPSPAPQPYQGVPNVIERLKQFTQAQLATHAAQKQAKVKRAQEISQAQAWLDNLDPLSDDGFWFEQFSERYDSRLQAALDFLHPGRSQE